MRRVAFVVLAALGIAKATACAAFGTGTTEPDAASSEASADSPDSTTDGGALDGGSSSDAALDAKRVGAFCDQARPDSGKTTFCDDFEQDRNGGWFPPDSIRRICNDGGVTSDDAGPFVGPDGDSCALVLEGIVGNAGGWSLDRNKLEHLRFTTRIRLVTPYLQQQRRLGFFQAISKQCEDFSLDAYVNDAGMADIRIYKGTLSGMNSPLGSANVGDEMIFDINVSTACELTVVTNFGIPKLFAMTLPAKSPSPKSQANFRLVGEWEKASVTFDNVLHEFAP